uniref:J domain-containing protein n=1 Tax=viral metagenome TaxID=1070528 RepID=A0A6C0DIH8_9ZZZZ
MDIKLALEILEIDTSQINYKNITLKYLKKKYHKLALQNHPDKNGNTIETKMKFQNINDAYHYLVKELNWLNECHDDIKREYNSEEETQDQRQQQQSPYMELLQIFMRGVFEGKYNDIIFKIIQDIVLGCKKISLKLFEDLDKDTCVKIYSFLSKYQKTLHINTITLSNMREIVQEKFNDVLVYKLNPSINDLINNNIFKLNVFDEICYVPLWIKESYFDISNCEIITLCEPELPDNILIDDNNNLYVTKRISIKDELIDLIQHGGDLKIYIGEKVFEIPTKELNMKKEQVYIIKNMGLLKNVDDIDFETYLDDQKNKDLFKNADIIVNIEFY